MTFLATSSESGVCLEAHEQEGTHSLPLEVKLPVVWSVGRRSIWVVAERCGVAAVVVLLTVPIPTAPGPVFAAFSVAKVKISTHKCKPSNDLVVGRNLVLEIFHIIIISEHDERFRHFGHDIDVQ
jgi:hypothetical protein